MWVGGVGWRWVRFVFASCVSCPCLCHIISSHLILGLVLICYRSLSRPSLHIYIHTKEHPHPPSHIPPRHRPPYPTHIPSKSSSRHLTIIIHYPMFLLIQNHHPLSYIHMSAIVLVILLSTLLLLLTARYRLFIIHLISSGAAIAHVRRRSLKLAWIFHPSRDRRPAARLLLRFFLTRSRL